MIWNTKVSGLMLPYSKSFNTVFKNFKNVALDLCKREKKIPTQIKKILTQIPQTDKEDKEETQERDRSVSLVNHSGWLKWMWCFEYCNSVVTTA